MTVHAKQKFQALMILVSFGVILSGCAIQNSNTAEQAGSIVVDEDRDEERSLEEKTNQIAENAFQINAEAYDSESHAVDDELTEVRMQDRESTSKIIAGWDNDSAIPQYLYQFDESHESPDISVDETYPYPNNMVERADDFLTKVLGLQDRYEVINVYGYKNRIAVLFHGDNDRYYHVAFSYEILANEDYVVSVVGYQIFDDVKSVQEFYEKQSARVLQ